MQPLPQQQVRRGEAVDDAQQRMGGCISGPVCANPSDRSLVTMTRGMARHIDEAGRTARYGNLFVFYPSCGPLLQRVTALAAYEA